jgi:hypothetical protein
MKKILAAFAMIAMLMTSVASVSAAANEFSTADFKDSSNAISNIAVNGSLSGLHFDIVPTAGTVNGTAVVVNVPNTFAVAGSPSVTLTGGANGTLTGTYVGGQVRAIIFNGIAGTESTLTVTFNDAAITLVSQTDADSGQYGFAVRTETVSSGVVAKTGLAILSVNNKVSVNATVQEALIMNIADTSADLNVDPSVNGGVYTGASTAFTIKSNAANGYTISSSLNQDLTGVNYGKVISSAAGGAENTWANSPTVGGNDQYFASGATQATGLSDITAISLGQQNTMVAAGNVAHYVGEFVRTLYYFLNVDYRTPADIYTAIITYIATPSF